MRKTTEEPLISFIITIYNLPVSMVRECIDSVMSLSLRTDEREIIVVDDGSDLSIIDDLADIENDITYLRQRNGGSSAARNAGLKMATGRYIQFIDGDDKLLIEGYEHCIDIIRYHKPDMIVFDYAEKETSNDAFFLPEPISGSAYLRHNNLRVMPWRYAFNRSILRELRFTNGLLHEDEEFTPLLILRAETLYDTKIKAYFYRQRSDSMSRNDSKRSIIKRLNDTERIIFHLQEVASSQPLVSRKALQRRVAQLTMDYIYNTMRLTRSPRQLEERIERLRKGGLFPLPNKRYTRNYTLFRLLTKSKAMRLLLTLILKIKPC